MSDKVIGGDCKLCGCRNHAPLTCEQWKAQVKNEMRGMYGSAFKARSTDKLYEPTALLDAVRAHRDNLMRMLDAAITERDTLAAENERLREVVKLGAKLRHLAAHKDEPYNSPHNAALYSAGDTIPISEGAFWEFVLSAYAMFPDEAKEPTT